MAAQRNQIPEVIARRVGGEAMERAGEDAPPGVPVALRTAQHVRVTQGRFAQTWSKRIVMAKWVISGESAMGIGSERITFGPGTVAIYLPSIPHRFWAVRPVNEMCWLTIDGPLAEEFVLQLGLRAGVYNCGAPPIAQIHTLMETLKDTSTQSARRGSLLALEMFYSLADSMRSNEVTPLIQRAKHIIEQEFSDPDLSAERVAAELSYHRGSLSRLFHKQTGTTLVDYLARVRLQQAKTRLLCTQDKVATIAEKCGFREVTYFCRWIRKQTGKTPRQLRQSP
jgi:AraC-like DNA-binding protein